MNAYAENPKHLTRQHFWDKHSAYFLTDLIVRPVRVQRPDYTVYAFQEARDAGIVEQSRHGYCLRQMPSQRENWQYLH